MRPRYAAILMWSALLPFACVAAWVVLETALINAGTIPSGGYGPRFDIDIILALVGPIFAANAGAWPLILIIFGWIVSGKLKTDPKTEHEPASNSQQVQAQTESAAPTPTPPP